VREESHLDDMRSAIRGDFERLADRRGGQELMRPVEPEPEPEPAPDSPAPEPETEPVPAEALLAVSPPDEPRRRSLLDRLLGR